MSKRRAKTQAPKQQPAPPFFSKLWICIALVAAVFAVYARVGHFDFVNFDDPEYVTANPHVQQGITPDSLYWAFTSAEAANWFPLTRLSHVVDFQLFGLDSGADHLVNVLLHALAAVLLFAFLAHSTDAPWRSAFVASLFALHPLHVESVAWIAERKDVLSAVFFFLALWAYVRGRTWLVVLAFCLGLLAKPMVITLPFVLLLVDIWPLGRKWNGALVREKIPLFALSAAAAVVTYFVQQNSRAVKTLSIFPLGLRVENALVTYVAYLANMFWPAGLAVFYPYPAHIPIWQAAGAALLLAAISVLVLRALRSHPFLAVGWFWYLGTLIPVIGLVQVGAQARADRYTYIPLIGIFIMLRWAVRPAKRPVVIATVAACAGCAILTGLQLRYWKNSEALFGHALEVTTGNYVAHHNFGLAIADQPGRLPEAIAHYHAALAIRPDSVEARTDLGTALAKMGRFEQAINEYEDALKIAPDCAICRANLGVARTQMAAAAFEKGVALAKSGQAAEAIPQFEAALRAQPDNAEAHNDLGVALGTLGHTKEAIEQFQAALKIRPDYADARYNLNAAVANQR